MNSLMQQLYMIPGFRNSVLEIDYTSADIPEISENLLYQFQYILNSLKESSKQYFNPKDFCAAFKDWDGNPVNVREQMDAQEYMNNFMDKLEGLISNSQHKNLIKEYFGGVITTEMIGKDTCNHRSERQEPSIDIQITIKNNKDIVEGLDEFVSGELLEKDNAYECDRCEEKITALRRQCIKRLPNVLVISLRRFEFDFETMQRLKLNDKCEFPYELDMEPYTQEGLEAIEKRKDPEFTEAIQLPYPDEYYKYKLKGVVVHMGTADAGHYYSFIKDRTKTDDVWYEFNDAVVKPFNLLDMESEAFGGEEKVQISASTHSSYVYTQTRERISNAYLLFYERDTFFNYADPEGNLPPLRHAASSVEALYNPNAIQKQVRSENERYWRSKNTFVPEFYSFVNNLWNVHSTDEAKTTYFYKFVCNFFLTVLVRSRDHGTTADFLQSLIDKMNRDLALWLSEVFCVSKVHTELLLDCPVGESRRFIMTLLSHAVSLIND